MVAKVLARMGGGLGGCLGLSLIRSGTPHLQHWGAVLPPSNLPALPFCEGGAEPPHLAAISDCHGGLKIAARG